VTLAGSGTSEQPAGEVLAELRGTAAVPCVACGGTFKFRRRGLCRVCHRKLSAGEVPLPEVEPRAVDHRADFAYRNGGGGNGEHGLPYNDRRGALRSWFLGMEPAARAVLLSTLVEVVAEEVRRPVSPTAVVVAPAPIAQRVLSAEHDRMRERLRAAIAARGWSQTAAAERLGLARGTLEDFLRGLVPSEFTAERVARWFAQIDGTPEPPPLPNAHELLARWGATPGADVAACAKLTGGSARELREFVARHRPGARPRTLRRVAAYLDAVDAGELPAPPDATQLLARWHTVKGASAAACAKHGASASAVASFAKGHNATGTTLRAVAAYLDAVEKEAPAPDAAEVRARWSATPGVRSDECARSMGMHTALVLAFLKGKLDARADLARGVAAYLDVLTGAAPDTDDPTADAEALRAKWRTFPNARAKACALKANLDARTVGAFLAGEHSDRADVRRAVRRYLYDIEVARKRIAARRAAAAA